LADDLDEFVFRQTGLYVHFDAAILEDLHGCRRKLIGDENFGHGLVSVIERISRSRPKEGGRDPREMRGDLLCTRITNLI
jgi:hypothetical protein